MNEIIQNINKFNTYEMLDFYLNIFDKRYSNTINKLEFFHSSPNYKILKILTLINSNSNISQAQLSSQLGLATSMINKYIKHLKKNLLICIKGTNNKNIKYFLTDKGKDFLDEYKYNFINDTIKLYKTILNEIEQSLILLKTKKYQTFAMFGINEFAEIIIETNLKKDMKFNIKGLFDSNVNKHKTLLYDYEIQPFDSFNISNTNNVLITSLSHKNEITTYLLNLFSEKINIFTLTDLLKETNFF
jgi:predicted transcriptional regulator